MQTILTYNDVQISQYVKVEDFRQEPIYTDDGADQTLIQTTITISFPLTPSVNQGGVSSPTFINTIRQQLLDPRGALTFSDGGTNLINIAAGGDARHGPKPQSLEVNEIRGVGYKCRYSIIAHTVACTSGQSNNVIISNRWSSKQSIDEHMMSARTITGRLIVDGTAKLTADAFRGFVIPAKPVGWVRTQEFTVQSDNLALDYVITDKEIRHRKNPSPIVDWDASYTESTETHGATVMGNFVARARGQGDTNTLDLLAFLLDLSASRIDFDNDLLRQAAYTERIDINEVSLNLVVMRIPPETSQKVPVDQNRTTRIGAKVKAVDDAADTHYLPRSAYLAELFGAHLQRPCDTLSARKILPGKVVGEELVAMDKKSTKTKTNVVKKLPPNNQTTLMRKEHIKAPYLDYKIVQSYDTDRHVMQIPVASSAKPKAAFVQLANKTTRLVIDWTAERVNQKPILPKALIQDHRLVLLEEHLGTDSFDVLPDGRTLVYRMDGKYIYGFTEPVEPGDIIIPTTPLLALNKQQTGTGQFAEGLV